MTHLEDVSKRFVGEAREIVFLISKHEEEIRKMGFASMFLEAIENSIIKLCTTAYNQGREDEVKKQIVEAALTQERERIVALLERICEGFADICATTDIENGNFAEAMTKVNDKNAAFSLAIERVRGKTT